MLDSRFAEKARVYWTESRVTRVTGGKKLLLQPQEAPHLLRVLGLLNADGSMGDRSVPKYRQINHLLATIGPSLLKLAGLHRPLYVLDACCGSSFLSFLVVWFLRERHQAFVRLVGLDRKSPLIEASRERAALLGWDDSFSFFVGEISKENWSAAVRQKWGSGCNADPNAVVALHACDTASDDALALGVESGADYLAVAPCCHAELSRSWRELSGSGHPVDVLFSSPNLRRDTAANVTDAMRVLLMESRGYSVASLEFVAAEHTPKNRVIVCERYLGQKVASAGPGRFESLRNSFGGAGIGLASRLWPNQVGDSE